MAFLSAANSIISTKARSTPLSGRADRSSRAFQAQIDDVRIRPDPQPDTRHSQLRINGETLMASIRKEFHLNVSAEEVWDALRDFYAVHERLAPGFLTALEKQPGA